MNEPIPFVTKGIAAVDVLSLEKRAPAVGCPRPRTSSIGRDRHIEAITNLLIDAESHVVNLPGKLGVEGRAAASTWAAQHGLA